MTTISANVIIYASDVLLIRILGNPDMLSEEACIGYCNTHNISCHIRYYSGPELLSEKVSIDFDAQGTFPDMFFVRLLDIYPEITIDIRITQGRARGPHYRYSKDGTYEVFDEVDFRRDISLAPYQFGGSLIEYKVAYQYMVPEFRSWTKRVDIDNAETVYGQPINFPDDLVPEVIRVPWYKDRKSFKREITTIVESLGRLEAIGRPENTKTSSLDDDEELPF